MGTPTHTRERIVEEAMRLFADQGFKATSVAQIEAAAGLSPGSGGLYKHFRSKEDVLRAGVERHVARADALALMLANLPVPMTDDPAVEIESMGRTALAEMASSRDVSLVVLREVNALDGILGGYRDRMVHDTYVQGAEWIRRRQRAVGGAEVDAEAHAFVAIAPLVLYRILGWLTGEQPIEMEEERLLATWVEAQLAVQQRYAASAGASAEDRDDDGEAGT